MKVYIERNNLQVDLIRYSKNVDLFLCYFCEATDSMQYRPPNVNAFLNNKHVGSVSDSLSCVHIKEFIRLNFGPV